MHFSEATRKADYLEVRRRLCITGCVLRVCVEGSLAGSQAVGKPYVFAVLVMYSQLVQVSTVEHLLKDSPK